RFVLPPGSFFADLPAGADVYVLSHVLHNWPDADAAAILDRCAASMSQVSRLVVAEHLLSRAEPSRLITSLNLRMLTTFGGRERSLEDFTAIYSATGLCLTDVATTPTGWSVMLCKR